MTSFNTDAELISNGLSSASAHCHPAEMNLLTSSTAAYSFHQTPDKENMEKEFNKEQVEIDELIASLISPSEDALTAKFPTGIETPSAPTDTAECDPSVGEHECELVAHEHEAVEPLTGSTTGHHEELTAAEEGMPQTQLSETDLDRAVEDMNQRFAWLTIPMSICRLDDGSPCKPETLRAHYANTHTEMQVGSSIKGVNHFDAWLKSPRRREHLDIDFVPGGPRIVNNYVNLWKKWGAESVAGDVQPWADMMDFIFAGSPAERKWAEQWFAYPIQYPGTKLNTAMVIWSSRQGVGKSLLGETVGRLYGAHFKTISAMELHSPYNGWTQDSLLILGEENSSADRRADSNKLKQMITGSTIFVNEKYRTAKECRNRMNFMFTSNHPNAFHLEIHDRRYFVWSVDSTPKPAKFYEDFVAWRNSETGIAALMNHLRHVDLAGFDPFGSAPVTAAKIEMIETSKSEIERWLTDALSDDAIDKVFGKEVVSLEDMVNMFQSHSGSRSNTTAMGNAMRRQCAYAQRRICISIPKKRLNAVSLRRHDYWQAQDNETWSLEYSKTPGAMF